VRGSRVLFTIAVGGALGLAIFAFLARRATRVEDATPPEALQRFSALRDTLAGRREALVWWDDSGKPRHRGIPEGEEPPRAPETLGVLAYRASDERLTEVVVPFWFVRLKEPALRFALSRADFDWRSLGLGAEQLRRAGPGLVLDERDAEGNLLLIWLR